MQFIWILMVAAGVLALFFMGARMTGGRGRRVPTVEHRDREGRGGRDLGGNINPSQTGNKVDLWPLRTGARTKRELGAREATDVTFQGEREENNKTATGVKQSDPAQPAPHPGIRREVNDGLVEARKDQPTTLAGDDNKVTGGEGRPRGATTENAPATADLDPEDIYGEDRPANRTIPPDQPPTQWHPREHGVPGDHIRDGHHRSATAPERESRATDPFAHGPTPGPNHIPPEEGVDFPKEIQP